MKTTFSIFASILLAVMAISCGNSQQPSARVSEFVFPDSTGADEIMIPYEPQGSHEVVTVAFNGVPMNLLWDTGCSTTTIPVTEYNRMVREQKITVYDYAGTRQAQIADGSIVESFVFNISTVTFHTTDGQPFELHDVAITVSPNPNSSLLLGKNIIDRLGQYRRDEQETCFVFKK